jgi:hypothetical protein
MRAELREVLSFCEAFRLLRDGMMQPLAIDAEVEDRPETGLTSHSALRAQWTGQRIGGDRAVRADQAFPGIVREDEWHSNNSRSRHLPMVVLRARPRTGGQQQRLVCEVPLEGAPHPNADKGTNPSVPGMPLHGGIL